MLFSWLTYESQNFPPTNISTMYHVTNARGATVCRCYMLLKLATMALLRYLRPIDNALDPQGPLSHSVPSVVISEVNREVNKAETRTKKRGSAWLPFSRWHGSSSPTLASQMSLYRLESEALHLDRTRELGTTSTCIRVKVHIT